MNFIEEWKGLIREKEELEQKYVNLSEKSKELIEEIEENWLTIDLKNQLDATTQQLSDTNSKLKNIIFKIRELKGSLRVS